MNIPRTAVNRHGKGSTLLFLVAAFLLNPSAGITFPDILGEVKSLSFFTSTSGLNPDMVNHFAAASGRGDSVFENLERARLKIRAPYSISDSRRLNVKVDYDHQVEFGSFVNTGDHRLARTGSEGRQFLDLSQTLADGRSSHYLHRLYRASMTYQDDFLTLEIGRQQIPWGKGQFFTPTDIFNPFSPTQIELEERDGVDAVHLTSATWNSLAGEFIYTPRGKRLHPQRIMGRIARDVSVYEVGLLGGRFGADHVVGTDFEGNLGDAVLRGEGLYQEVDSGKDFFKFTVNVDYNFPKNILAGVEYHFNGEGRRDPQSYALDRFVIGDIQQLGKNYGAFLIQREFSSLWTVANRLIMNMDDVSFFVRPEIQYEAANNLTFLAVVQLFLGDQSDEFGRGQNLYMAEIRYSF